MSNFARFIVALITGAVLGFISAFMARLTTGMSSDNCIAVGVVVCVIAFFWTLLKKG